MSHDDAFQTALQAAQAAAKRDAQSLVPAQRPKAKRSAYAHITEAEMSALAKGMPDLQSAILFVLTWHACRQRRMRRGELAGQSVARLSHAEIADITGRRKDCVKRAISKLVKKKAVVRERDGNQKTVYRMNYSSE